MLDEVSIYSAAVHGDPAAYHHARRIAPYVVCTCLLLSGHGPTVWAQPRSGSAVKEWCIADVSLRACRSTASAYA